MEALGRGEVHYGPSAGIESLRQAVADTLNRKRQISLSPDQVLITNGAVEALFLSLISVIDPGDEVLILEPAWTAYETIVQLLGGVPKLVRSRSENMFLPDLADCYAAVTPRTVALMINSPNNPTGAVIDESHLQGLAKLAEEHDLLVISDEVYEGIYYTAAPPPSISSIHGMAKRTAIVSAFSKTYSMTGWRLGYVALPVELGRAALLSHIHMVTSVNTFIQYGALAAFEAEATQDALAMVERYKARRELLLAALSTMPGVTCQPPQGGFFAFPRFANFPDDNVLARRLLEEANVATVPGSAFGPSGSGHLRLSFSHSDEDIRLGLESMREWLITGVAN